MKQQSKLIYEKVVSDEAFREAKSVGLFMSMPTKEVDTFDIIRECFDQNKNVYLPKCCSLPSRGNYLEFLQIDSLEEVASLQPRGAFNIREPRQGMNAMSHGSLDLLILPGVAFTREGARLGHGGGYYDKFVQTFESKFQKKLHLIGVGFREQLVDYVPTEAHDVLLNKVIVG